MLQPLQPRGGFASRDPPPTVQGRGGGSTRRSLAEQIPNPGGDFSVLSPGLAFGVEFYQQQLSKINKEACACQCSRGRARDWQSGTINYSSAPLPACRLQERPWQHAGEPGREGRRGIVEGRGNVVLDTGGVVPERVEAAWTSMSLLGVQACAAQGSEISGWRPGLQSFSQELC